MVNVRAFTHAPGEKLLLISLVASIATSVDELVHTRRRHRVEKDCVELICEFADE
jgi:hypothetical protein